MSNCDHRITKNDRCVQCGKLVFVKEKRKCCECRNFKDMGPIPICTKKLMGVTRNMHVCYRIDEGTCFEE